MSVFCGLSPCRGGECGVEKGSELQGENKETHMNERVKADEERNIEDLQ